MTLQQYLERSIANAYASGGLTHEQRQSLIAWAVWTGEIKRYQKIIAQRKKATIH